VTFAFKYFYINPAICILIPASYILRKSGWKNIIAAASDEQNRGMWFFKIYIGKTI
jgi:hypothetical protein